MSAAAPCTRGSAALHSFTNYTSRRRPHDDATSLAIFGTAGAGVDYDELKTVRVKDAKLFSGCIIALNPDTGECVWHFQTSSPGMQTENNHILMADLVIDGEKHHVAMTVPKNGFFYVLDAKSGKLLSANPLVKTTWATSYHVQAGHAVEVPVTFALEGEQFVITGVGWGSGSRLFARASSVATPESKRGRVRLLAFKLGATAPISFPKVVVPSVPEPPKLTAKGRVTRKL